MHILHGEHTIKSRNRLTELTQDARSKGQDVFRFSAKELTPALVEENLASSSLFGTEKIVVFEEVHSLPKSQKKDQLIKMLAAASDQPIILWEKRTLTPTMLKPFKNAKIEEFKLSSVLFRWLDSLGTSTNKTKQLQELHEIYVADGAEFCFAMLARQVRLLISAKDDGQLKGAPFIVSKLRKQAHGFTLEKLLSTHKQLLQFDLAHKQSQTRQTLEQELDLLIYTL